MSNTYQVTAGFVKIVVRIPLGNEKERSIQWSEVFEVWEKISALVMGSIDENVYRYNIDTLAKVSIVSILRYPSKNPHHKLHIHKFIISTYFNFWTSNFFKIFRFFWHFPRFCSVSGYFILDFFFWHFWSLLQWQYQVVIPK